MGKLMSKERAPEDYTELQRRVSVGAYEEMSSYYYESGTWPADGVEESINNLEMWAERQGLEFVWSHDTKTWSLEPINQGEDDRGEESIAPGDYRYYAPQG